VVIVTSEGTAWPIVLLWLGIVLALVAAVQYLLRARRELAASRRGREPYPGRE
jgi:hypothetical protein